MERVVYLEPESIIAGVRRSAMQTLADQLIDNVQAFARGEPKNRVT